jgi:hypothetical protein
MIARNMRITLATNRTFVCHGTIVKTKSITANDREIAALVFKGRFGQLPDTVNDVEVLGQCKACSVVLFDGDHYLTTEDECKLCQKCSADEAEEVEAENT